MLDPQRVATALGGEVSGNFVRCPGPGHSPADRSLSVKLDVNAPDGFLVHSFTKDDVNTCRDYVRAKCGLPAFKPNGSHAAPREDIAKLLQKAIASQSEDRPRAKPTATYTYTDGSDKTLYEVLRYDGPKQFLQRRPDGSGDWIWKLDEQTRVLYRLPELLKYPDGTVFITEGEKDALNVGALNLCATTVASGRWEGVDVTVLKGRDVIVLADVDAAGRKKAQIAARAVYDVAATVRIVELPGLTGEPHDKDVTDWLAGDSRRAEKLADICFDTPVWEPPADLPVEEPAAEPEVKAEEPAKAPRLVATPFRWRDPADIPPRRWIYGWHYIRRFTSATVSPGALGKSSLQLVEAIAVALKLPLLGIMPAEQCNVWYWNGEDPAEETERRIAAICVHYDIDGRKLEGRLFTDTGRITPIKMAALKRGEIVLDIELARDISNTIRENQIGVTIFDPLISVHDIPESDNTGVDAVAKAFGHIADVTDTAIEFAHHVRKPSSAQVETTVEDARGASALVNAVRSARVLNRMNREQAAELKIERPRRYFRVDNGKANMRPDEAAAWYHLENIHLPNGDQVGVVEAWQYPDPLARITPDHMRKVRALTAANNYRKDQRAEDWIGRAVAEVADLNADDKADLLTIKAALKAWFANGVLTLKTRKDEHRKERTYVVPGDWNEAGT